MNNTFSSQAGNFISALQTQVDPRTGQFMVNFPIVSLTGNNHLGPELKLNLNYSPLSDKNEGFGTGFSLGVTQFSNLTNLLELSNGEKYRVMPGTDTVRNHKSNHFHFTYANKQDDKQGYIVFWKNGKREHLTLAGENTFVTTRIVSPLGHFLTLEWAWNGLYPVLMQVCDKKNVLCKTESASTGSVMTVWPETSEAYQIRFNLINDNQLNSVSRQVSGEEYMTWYFTYNKVDGAEHLLLTGVKYPTGMTDCVEYSEVLGLAYPESSGITRYRLPAVLRHQRSPGYGQPETVRYYEYTQQNFLGYNGNFGNWSADNDYIYTTLTDYEYGSTETVTDGNVVVKTTRKYNNYHLQTREEVTRCGVSYCTENIYYAEKGCFIDSQPPQFQQVREVRETWTDETGKSREQLTITEFDNSGNPVRQVSPDGTETLTEWYASAGEAGCPPEPCGFVRFMKSQTVNPRQTGYDAPVIRTHYTYKLLSSPDHIVPDTKSTYANDVLMHQQYFSYHDVIHDAEYGRITTLDEIQYDGGETGQQYVSRQDFCSQVCDGELYQTTTFTGHDGLQITTSHILSAFSGNVLSETDAMGVQTVYTFDLMGRLLTRTIAPKTTYEHTVSRSYVVGESGPEVTETDASGNQRKTRFDGAGRIICGLILDKDNTQQWIETFSKTFNSLGEKVTGTSSDWIINETRKQYSMTCQNRTDAWGNLNQQSFSDGCVYYQNADPIALTQKIFMTGEHADNKLSSGYKITTFSPQNYRPDSYIQTDAVGKLMAKRQMQWDGLGRLRADIDERGNKTECTYDAQGRLVVQTLPDGTQITRSYAPHLSGNHVTSIQITGPDADGTPRSVVMGTQTFDSLGRVTRQTCGGRVTTYDYDGANTKPAQITRPSGKTIQYTYIPELGNALSCLSTDGTEQTFRYDARTGELLTATEGNTQITNTWTRAGYLKTEQFCLDDSCRSARYTRTLNGCIVTYTDIAGKKTAYDFDNHGRIVSITDDNLTASLTYNALGRLSEQTVTQAGTEVSLSTQLTYDDAGQEIIRTVTDSSGNMIAVSQDWLPNGLLNSRETRRQGIVVRAEQYSYDSRNRLTEYRVSGNELPSDAYGHIMTAQTYHYDALNNLTMVITSLDDGSSNKATYHYDNTQDPTQLTRVIHSHSNYPGEIQLEYNADGCMTRDEQGRHLYYDAMGRLVSIEGEQISGEYFYDALNRLVKQTTNSSIQSHPLLNTKYFYYRGNERINEVFALADDVTRLVKMGHHCLGIVHEAQLTLTAGDHHDSLLWSHNTSDHSNQNHMWSPYGSKRPSDESGLPGFNGECIDPVSGVYHLGNGYRAYNPVLMRFHCPDSMSPFGAGGINPYAYCAGEPVNHTDPSGHLSWHSWLLIGIGIAALVVGVATAGLAIAAAGGVVAAASGASAATLIEATAGTISASTMIASGALENKNPRLASALLWTSLASGVLAAGAAIKVGGLMKKIPQLLRRAEAGTSSSKAIRISSLPENIEGKLNVQLSEPRQFSHEIRGNRVITRNIRNGDTFANPVSNEHLIYETWDINKSFGEHTAESGLKTVRNSGVQPNLKEISIERGRNFQATDGATTSRTGAELKESFELAPVGQGSKSLTKFEDICFFFSRDLT